MDRQPPSSAEGHIRRRAPRWVDESPLEDSTSEVRERGRGGVDAKTCTWWRGWAAENSYTG